MTKVIYDPAGYEMLAEGHAGAGKDAGYDMVCCAVSTLMFTLVAALDVYGVEADGHAADGYLRIRAKPNKQKRVQTATAFETVAAGMELLAGKYPEHVKFEIR